MRTRCVLSLVVLAVAAIACGELCKPDPDAEQPKAMRILPGVLVKDSISGKCDRVDWKDFSYYEAIRATVTFVFGEAYASHGVEGSIRLFTFQGEQKQEMAIEPGKREYAFTFQADKDQHYFFKVEARKGVAGYMVETKVEPLDPCAACGPASCCKGACCPGGQVCRNGACAPADACVPACGGETVCVHGSCEPACSPPCHKPKHCDVRTRSCEGGPVPHHDTPAPRPKGCNPPCRSGETCDAESGECQAPTGITGTVLGVTDDGGGSIVLVNRGSQDGVRPGATARIGAFTGTVREVASTRCKVKVDARPDQLKSAGKVRISP